MLELERMSNDRLDAIASHAGSLEVALRGLGEDELMPFFVAELRRIQVVACETLLRRGVISDLEIDFDADTQPVPVNR